jgi:cell division septation protein DedD
MRRFGTAGFGIGQTILLLLGFLIASGLIFLFGVWVGRDMAERRLAQEERVVRGVLPAAPTPASVEAEGSADKQFYESLKATAYAKLQQTPPRPVAGIPEPTPQAPVAAAPLPTPALVAAATPAKRPKPAAATTDDEWADAGWTVQVNATTSEAQAKELARTLKAKGYDAYTLQVPLRGQVWFRVRVGKFSRKDEAKAMEERLKRDGMENAYVAAR